MFSAISFLACTTTLVSALTLLTPSGVTSGGTSSVNWTSVAGDPPTFSLELVNEVFHNAFAIANNVDTSIGSLTILYPIVPVGDGYTIEAVDIGNITNVYATTGDFAIGPVESVSASSSSSKSGTSTGTSSGTGTVVSTVTHNTTPTSTAPATAVSPPPTTSSTSPASSATGTVFSSASSLRLGFTTLNAGTIAIMFLAVIAGGAVVAL